MVRFKTRYRTPTRQEPALFSELLKDLPESRVQRYLVYTLDRRGVLHVDMHRTPHPDVEHGNNIVAIMPMPRKSVITPKPWLV